MVTIIRLLYTTSLSVFNFLSLTDNKKNQNFLIQSASVQCQYKAWRIYRDYIKYVLAIYTLYIRIKGNSFIRILRLKLAKC